MSRRTAGIALLGIAVLLDLQWSNGATAFSRDEWSTWAGILGVIYLIWGEVTDRIQRSDAQEYPLPKQQ